VGVNLARTFSVFLGGVLLSAAIPGMLQHLFRPDEAQWIVKAFTTPPTSPQWGEIWYQLQHGAKLRVYVFDPLGGLAVGVFVGMLQRRRTITLAAACMVPNFLFYFLTNHVRPWARSGSGVFHYSLDNSLPFIVATLTAALCQGLRARQRVRCLRPIRGD
jgi:hypothetical protein